MAIELRVLTGARSGQTELFDKPVIAIGRHPASDFLLDVKKDLDVSRRHAEIRSAGTGYKLYDKDSTNGTYVNNEQIPPGGSRDLRNGDTLKFGANGPTVAVVIAGGREELRGPAGPTSDRSAARPRADQPRAKTPSEKVPSVKSPSSKAPSVEEPRVKARPSVEEPAAASSLAARVSAARGTAKEPEPSDPTVRTTPSGSVILIPPHQPHQPPERQPTVERVAIAVKQQTHALRMIAVGAIAVFAGVAAVSLWIGYKQATEHDAEIQQLVAANEQTTRQFQTRLQGMNDTALTNALQRRLDSLTTAARGARDKVAVAAAQDQLRENHALQQKFNAMDLAAVRDANDPAVTLIVSEIDGKQKEATGFSVNRAGLIVTNRHVVTDTAGTRPSRILVKFANTRVWRHAHLVKLDDHDDVDLALIQIDESGQYPAVRGVARSVDTRVGEAIATIGYPLGTDIPMEGKGNDFAAKTSLTIGTVSKSVSDLLQIDAFASHGSSGSPVVDEHGHVVGVVWGGPASAEGRIVYAVPGDKIAALLKSVK
jgi:S1-C subfamily serine protease/pSer/pThr/pTyr-binding forkhead associated (FHA) protein